MQLSIWKLMAFIWAICEVTKHEGDCRTHGQLRQSQSWALVSPPPPPTPPDSPRYQISWSQLMQSPSLPLMLLCSVLSVSAARRLCLLDWMLSLPHSSHKTVVLVFLVLEAGMGIPSQLPNMLLGCGGSLSSCYMTPCHVKQWHDNIPRHQQPHCYSLLFMQL